MEPSYHLKRCYGTTLFCEGSIIQQLSTLIFSCNLERERTDWPDLWNLKRLYWPYDAPCCQYNRTFLYFIATSPIAITADFLIVEVFSRLVMTECTDAIVVPVRGWLCSEISMSNVYLYIQTTSPPTTAEEFPCGFKLSRYRDINCVTCLRSCPHV